MKDKENITDSLTDFHIVMDSDRLSKLDYFVKLFTIKKRPAFLRFLLESFSFFLEQVHFLEEELMGECRLINSNKNVKRKNIHLFIPAKIYRGIKMIHHNLDSFSMAQLIRIVIDKFLNLAGELGEGVCDYLKKMQQEWENVKEEHRRTKKPIRTIHMSKNKRTTSNRNQKNALKINYLCNFSAQPIPPIFCQFIYESGRYNSMHYLLLICISL